jgi:nicotinamide-nucleotide amidase
MERRPLILFGIWFLGSWNFPMQAEIISIGDELTTGQRLDTNSQWLAQRLLEVGVPVAFHTTVGDRLADNVLVFRQACERADIIVATGGLGPTADDLTRHALAQLAGLPLVQDDASLAHIKALFARRKREMPASNLIQAQFPQSSTPIHNPNGSAPGIDIAIPRAVGKPARIFALPGVPAEMTEMWTATVGPAIQNLLGVRKVITHHRIKCFGVGESDLEAMLPDLIARDRYPLVGITVHQATITLRITAEGDTPAAARAAMQPTIDTIKNCLGDLIFGEEDDELQHAVAKILLARGQTLALAEYGTAGLVAGWLCECVEEDVFRGGVVVCGIHGAASLLPGMWCIEDTLPDQDVFVATLAASVRERFRADYGLAIGPFPKSPLEVSAPKDFQFALATNYGPIVRRSPFAGHPDILRPRAAKQALNLLRLHLLGKD